MFERFTEKAIKVIMLAQEEARRLGHNFIGTEQLLLGLIGEGQGIAAKVLKSMGVNLLDTRQEVEKIIGRGSGFVGVEIPFTPRAKRVLELALQESRQLGHTYINTEHLLLGLIEENEGVAVRVLENFDIEIADIRNQVIGQIDEMIFEDETIDTTTEDHLSIIVIPKRIEKQIERLNVILTEAKKLMSEIEPFLKFKVSASSTDITNLINQLPDSPEENQPGIKELLTQLLTVIDADSELQSEEKNEALEQVIVLAAAGQNPLEEEMRMSAKTALKILKATIAELPTNNLLLEECKQLLPAIAKVFHLK